MKLAMIERARELKLLVAEILQPDMARSLPQRPACHGDSELMVPSKTRKRERTQMLRLATR